MPQLFTTVPNLDDAASYLSETTSYFTQCFSGLVEPENDINGQELMTFVGGSMFDDEITTMGNNSMNRGNSRVAHSSSSLSRRVGSIDSSSSASISAETSGNASNGTSLFQSLISRVRKTVRGSADDIGWLRNAPGFLPVEDATERFSVILDNVRKGEHKLPNSVVYLLIPGLFSNHGPLYFVNTKLSFSKMGLACHIAKIHSEASVEKNAREIKEYIEEIYWGSKKRVLLLGHSKGGVDAAAALSMYWSELEDKVAGLALAQSPYGGSPIASDILREGQLGDYVKLREIMEIVVRRVLKGDVQALEDLTYARRKEFLNKYHLPKELPVVSFHTEAKISPAVLSTLSRVAHAELPLVSTLGASQATKLPVIMPLAAAMAACAQLLLTRYGEKSDGLVTRCDAEVPGSVVVRPERKMDHAWMVYSSLSDDPGEASAAEVCEALLTLLVEVGQRRRHDDTMKDD